MKKKVLVCCSLISFFAIVNLSLNVYFHKINFATPIYRNTTNQYAATVLLIPLDSRPPCTQFVAEVASIANINLIIPPSELLDHYKQSANISALKKWLLENAAYADAAIVSTDMLVHGSLLSSRLATGLPSDYNDYSDVLQLLTTLHKDNPKLTVYVFNIIPRLLLADNQTTSSFQKTMLQYSILQDQIYTFENPQDIEKSSQLEQHLPPRLIERYRNLYQNNLNFTLKLIDLIDNHTIKYLVIGQDDGQPFGLPNMNKQTLQQLVGRTPALSDKISITRGTDEVALTLLGKIATEKAEYFPKVYVTYSDDATKNMIMPYMPHSIMTTVQEKANLLNIHLVDSPDEANFILFVHAGTKSGDRKIFEQAAVRLQNFINQGRQVALVDLSEHFLAEETLLPTLMNKQVEIHHLIAYAGWNTTSNSIGTALTQGAVFTSTLHNLGPSANQKTELYQKNLEFLTARLLDDWYFLKDVQPKINKSLLASKIDPYNLNSYYFETNRKINKEIYNKSRVLLANLLYNKPILPKGEDENIVITNLEISSYLPWQRTFELSIRPKIFLSRLE